MLHVKDLYSLLKIQLSDIDRHSGVIHNVGGGKGNSVSLMELTDMCRMVTGNTIKISPEVEGRPADIRLYISDNRKVCSATGWQPVITSRQIITDIYNWIRDNEGMLEGVLA